MALHMSFVFVSHLFISVTSEPLKDTINRMKWNETKVSIGCVIGRLTLRSITTWSCSFPIGIICFSHTISKVSLTHLWSNLSITSSYSLKVVFGGHPIRRDTSPSPSNSVVTFARFWRLALTPHPHCRKHAKGDPLLGRHQSQKSGGNCHRRKRRGFLSLLRPPESAFNELNNCTLFSQQLVKLWKPRLWHLLSSDAKLMNLRRTSISVQLLSATVVRL